MKDLVEFYHGEKFIVSVDSSIIPIGGCEVSIGKKTWIVEWVSLAVDYADFVREQRRMRCIVGVKPKRKPRRKVKELPND